MLMESWVIFEWRGKKHVSQNISGASQQNSIAVVSQTMRAAGDLSCLVSVGSEIPNWFEKMLFIPLLKLKYSI